MGLFSGNKDRGVTASSEGADPEVREQAYRAVWNGQVIAESGETIEIEGNQYFPPGSVKREFLNDNEQTSVCHWKGTASYYDVVVDGEVASGGAWYYPEPKDAVSELKDRVAFWRGVKVEAV